MSVLGLSSAANALKIAVLEAQIEVLTNTTIANAEAIAGNARDMDIAWLVICGERKSRTSRPD